MIKILKFFIEKNTGKKATARAKVMLNLTYGKFGTVTY